MIRPQCAVAMAAASPPDKSPLWGARPVRVPVSGNWEASAIKVLSLLVDIVSRSMKMDSVKRLEQL